MVRSAKPREPWLRADADALKSPKKRLSDKNSDRVSQQISLFLARTCERWRLGQDPRLDGRVIHPYSRPKKEGTESTARRNVE
jgi:hypothetical protein